MARAVISTVVLLPASTTQRLPLVSKASPTGFVKWVISGQQDDAVISTTPGEYRVPVPLLATQGFVPVVVTATGLENPENFGQVELEQDATLMALGVISATDPVVVSLVTQTSLLLSTAIPVGFVKEFNPEKVGQAELEQEVALIALAVISVTDPDVVSLVTQMLFLESTAIPVGEVNPKKGGQEEGEEKQDELISMTFPLMLLVTQMLFALSVAIPAGPKPKARMGQSVVVAQEVVPAGISMRPVLVVTQTSFLLSMAIFPKEVGELVPVGGEKEVEGGGLPPVPPPPVPQAGRDKRKIMRMNMRPARSTFCLIRFSPNL